jgi:polyadenylate-binding protein 2
MATTQEDNDLEMMRQKVKEMEQEAAKLREMQSQMEKDISSTDTPKDVSDSRSVYVGNVDYSATPEDLRAHFQSCGAINRITILCDKYTGHPKGYAYVEFAEENSVTNAIALSDSLFKGRLIKVVSKRANVPGYHRGGGRAHGRGYTAYRPRFFRGRGRGSGYYQPY